MVAVAAMTEGGFAGNLRYVALPAALVCVLAGAGWVELVRARRRRCGPRSPRSRSRSCSRRGRRRSWSPTSTSSTRRPRAMRGEADLYGPLPAAIAQAGGAASAQVAAARSTPAPFQVPGGRVATCTCTRGEVEIFAVRRRARRSPRATTRRSAAIRASARSPRHPLDRRLACRGRRRNLSAMATYASRPAWELRARALTARASRCPLGLARAARRSRCCCARRELGIGFWIDEGLSVGIADRPLRDIPRRAAPGRLAAAVLHAAARLDRAARDARRRRAHALSLLFALLASRSRSGPGARCSARARGLDRRRCWRR